MSTKISKKTFKELLRKLIQREIEEASTTANVPGYDTPRAFAGKGTKMGVPLDRRDSVASGSGYEKIDEADDHEGKMAKAQLERSMEYAEMIYKMIGNVDTDGDGEVNFPSWVQSYLTKSQDYLQSVYNYLDGKIEGKYRKSMYDLSDRLQADPKNHKLQDELVKSYTKNVTSFMRDMIKITKRMK